jgi:RNA polymerase sigma factor, sigma-70 family
MNNQDLAKIVNQVQYDKEKHFERLFNEIHKTIYYLSFKFLKNKSEAQDVSQDIILYIYNHIEELKVPESFNTWMNRIVFSLCQNRKVKLSKQKEEDYEDVSKIEEEYLEEADPEEVVQAKIKNEFVLEIIDDLPIKQKEVVLLYYYQQLTAPEIAEVLSCSLASIQNRLHNAKKSIKERVEKSKKYTVKQLFSVGIAPILFKLLVKEANKIVNVQVKGQLWKGFIKKKKMVVKQSDKQYKRNKYKTNKVRLYLVPIITILLLGNIIWGIASFIKLGQHQEQSEHQRQSEEIELQPESIISHKAELNTILNKNGNIKVEMLEEEQSTFVESTQGSWQLIDISKEYQIVEWNTKIEERFNNTAMMEDKDLEDLKYSNHGGNKAPNESVYEENTYKKDSDSVYMMAVNPILSFEKSTSLENQIITYYIHVENIGEVAVCNILVKDMIPEYTKYLQILEGQGNRNIQITARYKENFKTIFWNITELAVGEKATLAFQVEIENEAYKNNQEIRNIAYLKVAEQQSSLDSQSIEEQGYIKSNEIIHIMQHQKEKEPQTSDRLQESSLFFVLIIFSIIVIYKIVKKLKTGRNRKERWEEI